ncbi:transposase [Escherichia albertii]|uniref:transposase n=1 Tax=Escherichia albertii TaxID=208962 RepID=UPI00235FD0B2|nr:transposase [Escherichia albertii]WDC09487.1 transposase [Escherichia albertii]
MENPIYVNGRRIDSFGDWDTGIITQHPGVSEQRRFFDEAIECEQELKSLLKEIIYVTPETPQEMPDLCKTEALLELEKRYYPALKEQRIKLDNAYNAVQDFKDAAGLSEHVVAYEIAANPFVYYEGNHNGGYGTPRELVSEVIRNIPEGHRLIDVKPATLGSGQFILTSDKSDEEIFELAENNLLKRHADKLDRLKQDLKNELDAMKSLIAEYEAQKKIALQADIEQLLKVPQKYSKAL